MSSPFGLKKVLEVEYSTPTIQQYIAQAYMIDADPVHQRMPVENCGEDSKKSQGIIASLIRGYAIGQITLNRIPDYLEKGLRYEYESIDGGHRKRAILGFVRGNFCLGSELGPEYKGKYFTELTQGERDYFLQIKLSFAIYENLSNSDTANTFWNVNTTTPVNHQETMNAFGNTLIANLIRETARRIGGTINNMPHKLFMESQNKKGQRIGDYISRPNTRLSYDRLVARIACISHSGGFVSGCDDIDIRNMYEYDFTPEQIEKIRKDVCNCLDFIYECAIGKIAYHKKGAKLREEEFIMLMRLFFEYNERYKAYKTGWNILNYEEFYKNFNLAFEMNINKIGTFAQQTVIVDGDPTLRYNAFKNSLSKHSGKDHWNRSVSYLEEIADIQVDNLIKMEIMVIKTNRKVPKNVREYVFAMQGGCDALTGEKITMDTAQLDHISPWSRGGGNDLGNLQYLSRKNNQEKGSLTQVEYVRAKQYEENV